MNESRFIPDPGQPASELSAENGRVPRSQEEARKRRENLAEAKHLLGEERVLHINDATRHLARAGEYGLAADAFAYAVGSFVQELATAQRQDVSDLVGHVAVHLASCYAHSFLDEEVPAGSVPDSVYETGKALTLLVATWAGTCGDFRKAAMCYGSLGLSEEQERMNNMLKLANAGEHEWADPESVPAYEKALEDFKVLTESHSEASLDNVRAAVREKLTEAEQEGI